MSTSKSRILLKKQQKCARKNSQEILEIISNTRFSKEEIRDFEQKFNKVSNNQTNLDKDQFRIHMGILGMDSAYFLSDRIFAMLDEDSDDKVNFEQFIKYLDLLINGDQNEKNQWTFKLIDFKKKGSFDYNDFQNLINLMVGTWLFMTGNQMNEKFQKNVEKMTRIIFTKMDIQKKGIVTLTDFQFSLQQNPNLLEVYDILNNGITETFENHVETVNQKKLFKISHIIDLLILEIHKNSLVLSNLTKEKISMNSISKDLISRDFPNSHENFNEMKKQSNGFQPSISSQIVPILLDSDEESFGLQKVISPTHRSRTMQKTENVSIILGTEQENKKERCLDDNVINTYNSISFHQKKFNSLGNSTLEIKKFDSINGEKIDFFEIVKECRETNNGILGKLKEIKMLAEINSDIKNSKVLESYQKKTQELLLQQKIKKTAQNIKAHNNNNNNNKKKMVFLGNEKWNFVLNMMLGIQNAVHGVFLLDDYVLNEDDFKLSYSFEIIPRKTLMSKNLSLCYNFIDYAPYVFFILRKKNHISNEEYLCSIGVDHFVSDLIQGKVTTLSELISSGKSGCFFYYTADGKYTLKTIHKKEYVFFSKMLKKYYDYVITNPSSFLTKIYGLHKITFKNKEIYFIVMENILNTDKEIHKTYDLKGSLYKRETDGKEVDTPQKDKNALANNFKIRLEKEKSQEIRLQIEKDCEFLNKNVIIDYSFLVGVHVKKLENEEPLIENYQTVKSLIFENNMEIPAMNNYRVVHSFDNSLIYYFGIIDFFTSFDLIKKGEYFVKKLIYGPTISALPPKNYAERFKTFLFELLKEN